MAEVAFGGENALQFSPDPLLTFVQLRSALSYAPLQFCVEAANLLLGLLALGDLVQQCCGTLFYALFQIGIECLELPAHLSVVDLLANYQAPRPTRSSWDGRRLQRRWKRS